MYPLRKRGANHRAMMRTTGWTPMAPRYSSMNRAQCRSIPAAFKLAPGRNRIRLQPFQSLPENIEGRVSSATGAEAQRPWHFLYFLPEPQGQGSLGSTFFSTRTGSALGEAEAACREHRTGSGTPSGLRPGGGHALLIEVLDPLLGRLDPGLLGRTGARGAPDRTDSEAGTSARSWPRPGSSSAPCA